MKVLFLGVDLLMLSLNGQTLRGQSVVLIQHRKIWMRCIACKLSRTETGNKVMDTNAQCVFYFE